jgi:integrase
LLQTKSKRGNWVTTMGKRNNFGTVEKRDSGKFRARYTHPRTGERISAPTTYKTIADARLWLNNEQLAIEKGTWQDTRHRKDTVDSYGLAWIAQREIKQDTRDDYLALWHKHVSPFIGNTRLQELTPDKVRLWRSSRIQAGAGEHSVGYAYRILRAICNTALGEQVIRFQPCQVSGASKPKSERRTPLTLEQVRALKVATAPRYQALVLFLALTGLRIGEATALKLSDVDLDGEYPSVTVSRRVKAKRSGGGYSVDTPKTQAGLRTVQVPEYLVPILREHISEFVAKSPDSYLFATKLGNPAVVTGADEIRKGLRRIGLDNAHAHDLRHTSATMAIELGVPTQLLQARLGHASPQSTAIYTHGTQQGDRVIADKLSDLFANADNVIAIKSKRVS